MKWIEKTKTINNIKNIDFLESKIFALSFFSFFPFRKQFFPIQLKIENVNRLTMFKKGERKRSVLFTFIH